MTGKSPCSSPATVRSTRIVRYIGRVSLEQMDGVNEALQISLGLYIPEELEAP